MPPGFEPFLAAICAAPWDDLPRLVFADWLDDNGQRARAEFIRLQIAAARGGPDSRACQSRAAKLLHRHKWQWRERLPVISGVNWPGGFRRGFVSACHLTNGLYPDSLLAVMRAVPVEHLRANFPDAHGFRELASSPHLTGVCRLAAYPAGDAGARRLAANPAAERLEHLALAGWSPLLTDDGVLALARSPVLRRLNWVRITGGQISDAARSELRRRLRSAVVISPPHRVR